MQAWIDKDLHYTAQRGISGVLGEGLANVANWARSDATCLDIKDIEEDEVVAELEREVGNEREVIENAGIQIAAIHLGGEGPDVLDQGQGQGGALEMAESLRLDP